MVLVTPRHRPITPKGLAQKQYIEAIRTHDLTFGIGPAGTGKTYLAMAMAVTALVTRAYKRIILARPAVEAGEKLGFLPGDLAEKVNPYLRPLYDALHDMMDIDRAEGLISRGQIEVAPLAFMRGRTLNDCFVILDEAQNATSEQMRMFLTRLGYASKAVVTGDVTQVDLPQRHARAASPRRKSLLSGRRGHRVLHVHRGRRRAPPARAEDHRRLREARPERARARASRERSDGAARDDHATGIVTGRRLGPLDPIASHAPRCSTPIRVRRQTHRDAARTRSSCMRAPRGAASCSSRPPRSGTRARRLLAPFAAQFADGRRACSSCSAGRAIPISRRR